MIADSIQQTEQGNYLSLDPKIHNKFESIAQEIERVALDGSVAGYSFVHPQFECI